MAYKYSGTVAQKETQRRSSARRRKAVLAAYGGVCACCGEAEQVFLTIDHINNNGAAERKITTSGTGFYSSLRKRGYPEGYQVLCRNCNWAKHVLGSCPHKDTSHGL